MNLPRGRGERVEPAVPPPLRATRSDGPEHRDAIAPGSESPPLYSGVIALLAKWREEDREIGEDRAGELEQLKRDLDSHRSSDQKLFP